MKFYYTTARYLEPLESMNSNEPLAVDFEVRGRFEDEIDGDIWLSGRVDWQDGVHLWQSECIEPDQWTAMMACALDAIKDCRKQIGSHWISGEPA